MRILVFRSWRSAEIGAEDLAAFREALLDSDLELRLAAVEALGRMAERSDLELLRRLAAQDPLTYCVSLPSQLVRRRQLKPPDPTPAAGSTALVRRPVAEAAERVARQIESGPRRLP